MAAEFSVWANDKAGVKRSNKKAHNSLGPKERSLMIVSSVLLGLNFYGEVGAELCSAAKIVAGTAKTFHTDELKWHKISSQGVQKPALSCS
jgi:hypothetical protein